MAEFLGYSILILVGLFIGFMLWKRIRGHGTGCCGGGHQHEVVKSDDLTSHQNKSCH